MYCSFFIYKAFKSYFRELHEPPPLFNGVVADNYPELYSDTDEADDADDADEADDADDADDADEADDAEQQDDGTNHTTEQGDRCQESYLPCITINDDTGANIFKQLTSYTFPIINTAKQEPIAMKLL